MTPSEQIAADIRADHLRNLAHEQRNRPIGGGGGGPAGGGGWGNAAGWAVFFAMVGAVLGGIAGTSVTGAVVGAAVLGGGVWVLSAFGRSGSRVSVLKHVGYGMVAGVAVAYAMSLEYPGRMETLLTNWLVMGAVGGGVIGLVRRALG